MALPCSTTCDHYMEGCHKTCPYWQSRRREIQENAAGVRAFLKESNECSAALVRQLSFMTGTRRSYR